ncbi:MAG: response regulator [Gammaproteobacteria bacterium]|nr:response regulator [Gammaproteobacteria bacterium]
MTNTHYQVLCVDDHDANLFSLEQLLQDIPKVKVIKALSGTEALNILLTQPIDLILLDIQMPGLNGYEVADILRKNQLTRNIPIIFLTAVFKTEEFISRGFKLGAIDYLTKPLDDNQLINRIQLYLNVLHERDQAILLQKQYQGITDSMGEGLYVLNEELKVDYINQSALHQLGFSHSEIIHKKIHDLVHYKDSNENYLHSEDCIFHAIFKSQQAFWGEQLFIRKDGSQFPALASAAPIMDGSRCTKVIVLFQDISEKIEQEGKLLQLEQQRIRDYDDFINSLVNVIEKRDTYTAGHSERVAVYCEMIARELGFKEEQISLLVIAAKLHDIGKISTPDSILLKPGKLEKLEYNLIKYHLNTGYEILKSIESYQEVAEIMRYHHERYDGKGYPEGFSGDKIPLISHVMIVSDAFDAMTTNRIYKPRMKRDNALNELIDNSGSQFHPHVVEAAIKVLSTLKLHEKVNQLPKDEVEHHRFSYFFKDKLTRLFLPEYERLVTELYFSKQTTYRYVIRLQNFSEYNKRHGWDKGDDLLEKFGKWLMQYYPDAVIFRIEGDDFMIVSPVSLKVDREDIKNYSTIANTCIEAVVETV